MTRREIKDEALRLSREHRLELTSFDPQVNIRRAIAIGIRYGRKHPNAEDSPVMIPRMKLGRVADGEALDGATKRADIPRHE